MFKNIDWNTTYSLVFTIGGLATGLGVAARHFVHRLIEDHVKQIQVSINEITNEIRRDIEPLDKRLDRIEYALYNDGKTGLVNKVDDLLTNQQNIKIDVEVLKEKVA